MYMGRTTIAVSRDLKNRLSEMKADGESFEDLIRRLIEGPAGHDRAQRNVEQDSWSPSFTAVVEKKYRLWIPKVIRDYLGLSEGDYVEVKVRPVRRKGILRK